MDLTKRFLDKVMEKAATVPVEFFEEAAVGAGFPCDLGLIERYLHEDYSLVLDFAAALGMKETEIDEWCDECDCEVVMKVSLPKWEYTCSKCGTFYK